LNSHDHFTEDYEVVVEYGYPSAAQQAEQDESDRLLFPAHTLNEELDALLGITRSMTHPSTSRSSFYRTSSTA
jgi:hypothetical protein